VDAGDVAGLVCAAFHPLSPYSMGDGQNSRQSDEILADWILADGP